MPKSANISFRSCCRNSLVAKHSLGKGKTRVLFSVSAPKKSPCRTIIGGQGAPRATASSRRSCSDHCGFHGKRERLEVPRSINFRSRVPVLAKRMFESAVYGSSPCDRNDDCFSCLNFFVSDVLKNKTNYLGNCPHTLFLSSERWGIGTVYTIARLALFRQ